MRSVVEAEATLQHMKTRTSPLRVEAAAVSLSLPHGSVLPLGQQVTFLQRLQALAELQEGLKERPASAS